MKLATVSCHVERPLDDRCWSIFSELQALRPDGFRIAALMRPPDPDESETLWLARARIAAARGPLGHHTHWGGANHARPPSPGGWVGERVRREAAWLREHGLEPKLFCGGGWYMDEGVAAALAELGYTDCTATAFRPPYLDEGAPRLELAEPGWVQVGATRLPELPATHSVGMAARAALRRLPRYVHVYFHDTDLLDGRRRRALVYALALIARRRRPTPLDSVWPSDAGVT